MAPQILVPIDGSPLSEQALSVALDEYPDSTIRLLHVIDPTEPGYSYVSLGVDAYDTPRHGSDEWYDRADAFAEELFEAARKQASDETDLTTETRVGRPDREIVRYIEDADVDHVILGSHGRDRESLTLVGGVAEAVVFRSPVRVTLVK